jgi:hypothetical protein
VTDRVWEGLSAGMDRQDSAVCSTC